MHTSTNHSVFNVYTCKIIICQSLEMSVVKLRYLELVRVANSTSKFVHISQLV